MLLAHASAVEPKKAGSSEFLHTDHCEAAIDGPTFKVLLLLRAETLQGLCVQSFICRELHQSIAYTYSFFTVCDVGLET